MLDWHCYLLYRPFLSLNYIEPTFPAKKHPHLYLSSSYSCSMTSLQGLICTVFLCGSRYECASFVPWRSEGRPAFVEHPLRAIHYYGWTLTECKSRHQGSSCDFESSHTYVQFYSSIRGFQHHEGSPHIAI